MSEPRSRCREFEGSIQLLLARELDASDEAALMRHIAGCSACADMLADFRHMLEAFDRVPDPKLSDYTVERSVRRAVKWAPVEERTATASERRSSPVRRRVISIAASFLIIIVGAAVAGTLWRTMFGPQSPGATLAPRAAVARSVAVIPFSATNVTQSEALALEAVHEGILQALSLVDSLTVIARESVIQYRSEAAPGREMATELGVAKLLRGAVDRSEGALRLRLELVEASTGDVLWAAEFEHPESVAAVAGIKADVAAGTADALGLAIDRVVEERLRTPPTADPAAFELYTRARYTDWSREGRRETIDLLERAIELDPGFIDAYAELSWLNMELWNGGYLTGNEPLERARLLAERVLELDPLHPEAHASLAWLLAHENRFDEAQTLYLRALELNPNSADTHRRYSGLLLTLGRFDAMIEEARIAWRLNPRSAALARVLANRLTFARRYEDAVEVAETAIDLEPGHPSGYLERGMARVFAGDHASGLADLERARGINSEWPYFTSALAWAHAAAADSGRALELVARLPHEGQMLKEIAFIHAQLGNFDAAFDYLARAAAEEPASLVYLDSDPTADPLRQDARYGAFLDRHSLRRTPPQ